MLLKKNIRLHLVLMQDNTYALNQVLHTIFVQVTVSTTIDADHIASTAYRTPYKGVDRNEICNENFDNDPPQYRSKK
jgi:hypothetical protein